MKDLKMLTEKDIEKMEKIKTILSNSIATQNLQSISDKEWEIINLIGFLDDVKYRLEIAPQSYRECDEEDTKQLYYTAKCGVCGWYGSSALLLGGDSIGDTGDYDDVVCPICGNKNIDEK